MLTITSKSLHHSKIVWSYLLETIFGNDFAHLKAEIHGFLLSCLMRNTLYSKYQSFKSICLPLMNSPVFPSLDDIYCILPQTKTYLTKLTWSNLLAIYFKQMDLDSNDRVCCSNFTTSLHKQEIISDKKMVKWYDALKFQ